MADAGTERAPSQPDAVISALRRTCRMLLLTWHALVHLPLVLLLISLPTRRLRLRSGETLESRLIRAWSAGLLRVFGMRPRRHGQPLPGAVVFVANHIGWTDIVVLHSQRMMGFVAKREIAGWPVVGWLAKRGHTIFHTRGNTESLGDVMDVMQQRLRNGEAVGVFPEGRTRSGHVVGPFHARIFLAAVETAVPVQPVALRYGEGGSAQTIVAFGPDENFFQNFMRLLGEPARPVDVLFLPPILPGSAAGRRNMAESARSAIVQALEQA